MRFFAIFCPPVAVLMARKPFQALIAFGLWLLLWIPGSIYAWGIVTDYKADQRMKKQVKYTIKAQGKLTKAQQKDWEESQRMMAQDDRE